jgi:N6-L-threonylcarbamoyladenine synthase
VRILGIETSCDETAAAIVEDGARILSNVVASQMATHAPYGGVVPELASREHLRAIVPVVREAFTAAGLRHGDVDAVAVTAGPGLVGSLLVGITYAKTVAMSLGKPLLAVNHLEGHVHAVPLEQRQRGEAAPEFPALALLVSGGHTLLLLVEEEGGAFHYRVLGRTRDDAAGEAYDKVAKLLGLGYPGGPVIDRLAKQGNPAAVSFTPPKTKGNPLDFSFSGIKTAVLRYVQAHHLQPGDSSPKTLDLLASFQHAVVEDLFARTRQAARQHDVRSVIVSGGVACNSRLRERFRTLDGLPVYFPSPALCTDNAAMIAAAAFPKLVARQFAGLDLAADANLRL